MAIVDAPLIAACKAIIDSEFGPVPAGLDSALIENYRLKLATCIAKAAQYVRDNGEVVVGIPVLVNIGTGVGATTSVGTLS